MNRPLVKGKEFESENLNDLVKRYDFKNNKNLLLLVEEHEEHAGADLVVYDVDGMLEYTGKGVEEFKSIVNENALDEEEFEIDRFTLVRIDNLF